MNCFCRQKVTRTIDTGAGFFLEEEDQDESKSKTTEVKHPLGEVKVIMESRSQLLIYQYFYFILHWYIHLS